MYFQDDLRELWNDRVAGEEPALSGQELSDATMERIRALADTPDGRLALSERELQALLDYEYASSVPTFLTSPGVDVDDGSVRLSGRVSTDFIREYVDLGDAAGFLPDTVEVAMRGHLIPAESGRAGLAVEDVSAARIPVPDRLMRGLLRSVGAGSDPSLGADVVPLPLPEPLESAYVHGDSVVLTTR